MARITWLSFLLCALSLLVALLAARVLFVFWKSAAWKSLLLLGVYLLADFGLRWFTAYSEYTADMFLLEGLHTFLFGNAYAAPSLFCAKVVQLTVLSLCLSIGNRFGSKEQHKENFQGKTVFTVLRGVAVCAVTVLGICAVYYCTDDNNQTFSPRSDDDWFVLYCQGLYAAGERERAKQLYTDHFDSAENHMYYRYFIVGLLQDRDTPPEDVQWAKAQIDSLITAIQTEEAAYQNNPSDYPGSPYRFEHYAKTAIYDLERFK